MSWFAGSIPAASTQEKPCKSQGFSSFLGCSACTVPVKECYLQVFFELVPVPVIVASWDLPGCRPQVRADPVDKYPKSVCNICDLGYDKEAMAPTLTPASATDHAALLMSAVEALRAQGRDAEAEAVQQELDSQLEWVTAAVAADRAGVSAQTIKNWVTAGVVRGRQPRARGAWQIERSSLERCLARRDEVARAQAALRGDQVSRLAYMTGEDPDDLR